MKAFLVYTTSRLALFAATYGLLWVFGAKSWLGLLLALLISGVVSYVLLSRQRDAFSAAITQGSRRLRRRIEESAAAEDAATGETPESARDAAGEEPPRSPGPRAAAP